MDVSILSPSNSKKDQSFVTLRLRLVVWKISSKTRKANKFIETFLEAFIKNDPGKGIMRHLQSTNTGILHSITVTAAVAQWVRALED